MNPRVAIVAYTQETSTFTPQRTTLDTFRAYGLAEGAAALENRSNHEIGGDRSSCVVALAETFITPA